MARNEEKHYGRLNRLYLMKEKEEHEKANPKRPYLNTLDTPEEIQKWLPSIKKDIDFYLKKSQVPCYSDAHVEECKKKVDQLEKEFKAFVRKIQCLSPSPLDVIPWTTRPYKKQKLDSEKESTTKEYVYIPTPILDNEKSDSTFNDSSCNYTQCPSMDLPLNFTPKKYPTNKYLKETFKNREESGSVNNSLSSSFSPITDGPLFSQNIIQSRSSENVQTPNTYEKSDFPINSASLSLNSAVSNRTSNHLNLHESNNQKDVNFNNKGNLVNYDSSDSDS